MLSNFRLLACGLILLGLSSACQKDEEPISPVTSSAEITIYKMYYYVENQSDFIVANDLPSAMFEVASGERGEITPSGFTANALILPEGRWPVFSASSFDNDPAVSPPTGAFTWQPNRSLRWELNKQRIGKDTIEAHWTVTLMNDDF